MRLSHTSLSRTYYDIKSTIHDQSSTKIKLESFFNSNLIEKVISQQLDEISYNENYTLTGNIGRTAYVLIEDDEFKVSVQILDSEEFINNFEWSGGSSYYYIRTGQLEFILYSLPRNLNINRFEKGVKLKLENRDVAYKGQMLDINDLSCLASVRCIGGPVVLYDLTIENKSSNLTWFFDSKLESYYTKPSKQINARLRNAFSLIEEMGGSIPSTVYDTIMKSSDPVTKLIVLREMIKQKDVKVIDFLCELIDSKDETLKSGSRKLLKFITESR